MCTVTWLRSEGGYRLLFNRDERLTRSVAEPPTVRTIGGVQVVAPTDPDGGGSWIAANGHGITLGLLNGYLAADDAGPSPDFVSRGQLVLGLATGTTASGVIATVSDMDLVRFRSFRLLAVEPDGPARMAEWDRERLTIRDDVDRSLPIVSCPDHPPGILEERRAHLMALTARDDGVTGEVLDSFHRSHSPAPGAFSVCTHRHDARTHSLSEVVVTRESISFAYADGPPCEHPPLTTLEIPRVGGD